MEIQPKLAEVFGKMVGRAMQERMEGTNRPFTIFHFVTHRCMCHCQCCLWRHNDWEDMPLEELKRFYLDAAEQGFLGTAVSGGEPFLRKDLGELLKFIKQEAGMATLLFNTGWFLKERMDETLPYVDLLLLSLDSAKPEQHDKMRGVDGLFDRLMEAIDAVKDKYPDLPIRINTCIRKGTADGIEDLIRLTQEKGLKISFDVITEFRHGIDGSRFVETDQGMPLTEVRDVCGYLLERKREGAPIFNSESYFKYFVDSKPGYKCHFPKLVMQVDGRGNVENCLDLGNPIANIRQMPLGEIMELERFKQLRKRAEECCSCNSPTMIDLSNLWENPSILFEQEGITVG